MATPSPSQLPIAFHQLFELSKLNINPANIGWGTVTVSDKFVCVREGPKVLIIDSNNWSRPEIRQIESAEATIMHPSKHIFSVRAGGLIQVYQLQPQQKLLGEHNMGQEAVEFWKWVDETTIALVTSTAVYHWEVTKGLAPVKFFDRAANLAGHQIINYHGSHDKLFYALVGIARGANGRTVGHTQLYSVAMKGSQPIEAHACTFSRLKRPGQADTVLFSFAQRNEAGNGQLWLIEMGGQHKVPQPIVFPDSNPGDFPLVLVASDAKGVLFMLTKEGFFHMYDGLTGKRLMANKVSAEHFFIGGAFAANDGVFGINKTGSVLSLSVNSANMVPYVLNVLRDQPLALSLAQRGDYPGLAPMFQQQFQQFIQQGQYQQAAKLAASSPQGCLRTPATIQLFKSLPATQTSAPLRDYYSVLLDHGKLNEHETMELVQPVIMQERKDLIVDWLAKDKLFCTPELGRMVLRLDVESAVTIFKRSGNKEELAKLYAELCQFDQLLAFVQEENFNPNWMALFVSVLNRNPANAASFARSLIKRPDPLLDTNAVVDALMERNMVKDTTSLLLDVLENKEEHGALQTKLFEINLKAVPHIANALFENNLFSFYDKQHIAHLCEQVGFYQRALQHYTDITDVRRLLISYGSTMQIEFVVTVFGKFTPEARLELMRELLKNNNTNAVQTVAQVGVKFTGPPSTNPDPSLFNPHQILSLFEEFQSYEGSFAYLQPLVALFATDKDLVFKYIEAASKLGFTKEVETAVRDYEYDPEKVREFLKEIRLDNQLPLIRVCDRHGFVADLAHYLYRNNLTQYLQIYVQQLNPLKTPEVVGALLDENASDESVQELITAVGHLCPVGELVEEVEKRERLPLLTQWLEARFNEGNKEPATHNALAKILISSGDDRAEPFITNNEFYEPTVVGKYAEAHNTSLAYKIYSSKKCSKELVAFTNANGMYREQARYLVLEQLPELWAFVLDNENTHRRAVVDQVIQTVLPEIPKERADLVSATVQAFMHAKLPLELMELLERIVLNTEGKVWDSQHLQTLLILTAIKADKTKVMDYVIRLDGYDPPSIADMALKYELPEVAFTIYNKFKVHVKAAEVLVNQIGDLERAKEFAETCNEPAVYSVIASAQLAHNNVTDAIASFLKASDASKYEAVIVAAKNSKSFDKLVEYLKMCRQNLQKLSGLKSKEKIEAELVYALAQTNQLSELESFISSNKNTQLQTVGDSCFNEGLFEAARVIFNAIGNWSRLVSCLVKLKNFSAAIEAARKSNHTTSWKEVCRACIENDPPEFRLAQLCGLNLINTAQELDELVHYYEIRGYVKELMALLEAGLTTDTSIALSTTLAILYSKYNLEKLAPHLQLFKKKKLNISKIVNVCVENKQWAEISYLHELDGDFDRAVRVIIEHPEVWKDSKFREVLVKVKSTDRIYDAIKFYLDFAPEHVVELLGVVSNRLDPVKVVQIGQKLDAIYIIQPFLELVQEKNIRELNNVLNELYIQDEDFIRLRESIARFDNFDSIGLAKSLESSQFLEARRVAAHLYRMNKRWKQSVDLSKKDKMYKDSMETIAESKDQGLAEELLRFFIEPEFGVKSPHCFSACLYTCYDLIRPDVVLELAWRHQITDFIFPYLIQTMRDFTTKVNTLHSVAQAQPLPTPGAVPVPGFVMGPNGPVQVGSNGQPGGFLPPPGVLPPGFVMGPNGPVQVGSNGPHGGPPGVGLMPPGQPFGF
eukprot:TRINITY_DN1272_c0_g1_i1.p1 TRINITY_DN1272_c0_g1~~TRINITY_DN1272_c0_g1_i1.p1  ORF type:complete len:1717 (+),score=471.10 TRINITY_DN1272_c0_g1_i1:887-6037(+)